MSPTQRKKKHQRQPIHLRQKPRCASDIVSFIISDSCQGISSRMSYVPGQRERPHNSRGSGFHDEKTREAFPFSLVLPSSARREETSGGQSRSNVSVDETVPRSHLLIPLIGATSPVRRGSQKFVLPIRDTSVFPFLDFCQTCDFHRVEPCNNGIDSSSPGPHEATFSQQVSLSPRSPCSAVYFDRANIIDLGCSGG